MAYWRLTTNLTSLSSNLLEKERWKLWSRRLAANCREILYSDLCLKSKKNISFRGWLFGESSKKSRKIQAAC